MLEKTDMGEFFDLFLVPVPLAFMKNSMGMIFTDGSWGIEENGSNHTKARMEREYYPYFTTVGALLFFFWISYMFFVDLVFMNFKVYKKASKAVQIEWKSR